MKETDLKEAFDAKYPEVTPFVKTWMDGIQTLIREQERERCAKVCENMESSTAWPDEPWWDGYTAGLLACAKAIGGWMSDEIREENGRIIMTAHHEHPHRQTIQVSDYNPATETRITKMVLPGGFEIDLEEVLNRLSLAESKIIELQFRLDNVGDG